MKTNKVRIGLDIFILMLVGVILYIFELKNVDSLVSGVNQVVLIFLVPLLWFTALTWQNAWVFVTLDSPSKDYVLVLRAGAITYAGVAIIHFTFKAAFSRSFVLIVISIGSTLLLLQRMYSRKKFWRSCLNLNIKQNILVLACCDTDLILRQLGSNFSDAISHTYRIDSTTTAWVSEIEKYLKTHEINMVMLCSELATDPNALRTIVHLLDQVGCELLFPDNLGEISFRRRSIIIGSVAYSFIDKPIIQHSKAHFKRFSDLVISTLALILLAPFMVVIGLTIKCTSKGKIFYTDYRVGLSGVEFKFPKFRTMRSDAALMRLSVLGRPDENMAQRYRVDPRITPVGKFLRRFSLDELPQFWCVLVGTMSVVGPRPILREELIQLTSPDNYRHLARPGLTGLWQVSGRKETTWEERMALDVEYVKNWSPFNDAILILRTFFVILTGVGSY